MISPCAVVVFLAEALSHPLDSRVTSFTPPEGIRSTCEGCPRALGATLFGVRAPLYDKCHHGACCKPVLSLFLCSTVCMAGNGLRCDECRAAFTGRPIQPLQTLSVLCSTNRTCHRSTEFPPGDTATARSDRAHAPRFTGYIVHTPVIQRVGGRPCDTCHHGVW